MSVALRPLDDAGEIEAFRAQFVPSLAEDFVALEPGLARADALARAAAIADAGLAKPGRALFAIVAGGVDVGTLWLELDGDSAHVADIAVAPEHRGRGHGRRALELAEDEARRRGATRIGLNVFAHNPRARALYERAGYAPVSTKLTKRL